MSEPESPPLAVITGGEGDLARGIAEALRNDRWEVRAPGHGELDVTSPDAVTAWFDELDRVDLLVNNAGVAGDGLVLRQSPVDWSATVDVNLKGAFLCSQAAAVRMLRQRSGHLIQIGSFAAHHPGIGQSAYAAAKAGLEALTRSLAAELGGRNIRVNCVLPGFLETRMTASLPDQVRDAALRRHQLRRFNTVAEAARFIAFLATLDHVSGQVFQLDSRVA